MRMRKRILMMFRVAATVVLFGAVTALAQNVNQGVAPPNSKPYGKTYGEWAAAWGQWNEAIPLGVNPANDPSGLQGAINQSGPVWFLAGTFGGSATRQATIPAGTAIFFPLIDYLDDYPCPNTSYPSLSKESLEAFLIDDAAKTINQATGLEATLAPDHQPPQPLSSFRFHSKLFSFTAAADLLTVDPCVTGSPQLAVVDGYWLLLKPLSPGTHTLTFGGTLPQVPFRTEVTYHLTIVGEGGGIRPDHD